MMLDFWSYSVQEKSKNYILILVSSVRIKQNIMLVMKVTFFQMLQGWIQNTVFDKEVNWHVWAQINMCPFKQSLNRQIVIKWDKYHDTKNKRVSTSKRNKSYLRFLLNLQEQCPWHECVEHLAYFDGLLCPSRAHILLTLL